MKPPKLSETEEESNFRKRCFASAVDCSFPFNGSKEGTLFLFPPEGGKNASWHHRSKSSVLHTSNITEEYKMKKIISLLLAVAMVMSVCVMAAAADDVTEMTLKVWGPQEDQVDENSFLQVATAKFAEAHPEWKINWVFEVCSEGDAGTNVTKDPAAAADVYAFANDQLGTLLQANAVARLGGDVLAQVQADNSETMIASVTSGEGVYGVPFTGNTWFMYYESSAYTEEDIKSLDAMMEKGTVAFPVTDTWYLPAFYYAMGGTMFGDGTDGEAGVVFGGENGAKATTYVAEALASGKLINDADGAGLSGLRDGSVKAMFSGTWNASAVKEALGENYAAAQLPCITVDGEEHQLYSFAGSKAYAANPNSANLKAATALAAWLGSADMQDLHYQLRNGGVIPCSTSLIASGNYDGEPAAVAQNSTIANTSKLQPSIPEMGTYWSNAESMGKALVNGEINADNAAEMTEKWNAGLNNAGL